MTVDSLRIERIGGVNGGAAFLLSMHYVFLVSSTSHAIFQLEKVFILHILDFPYVSFFSYWSYCTLRGVKIGPPC